MARQTTTSIDQLLGAAQRYAYGLDMRVQVEAVPALRSAVISAQLRPHPDAPTRNREQVRGALFESAQAIIRLANAIGLRHDEAPRIVIEGEVAHSLSGEVLTEHPRGELQLTLRMR